jgi:hypothetical protein
MRSELTYIIIGFIIMLIIIFCFILIIFDDVDKCLDNGGSWDKKHNVCLY